MGSYNITYLGHIRRARFACIYVHSIEKDKRPPYSSSFRLFGSVQFHLRMKGSFGISKEKENNNNNDKNLTGKILLVPFIV